MRGIDKWKLLCTYSLILRRIEAGPGVLEPTSGDDQFANYQHKIIKNQLPALPVYTKVYGSIFQTAYYFIDIFLGAPKPQEFSMIVDTGSSTQGLPCSNCRSCGVQHWEKPYKIENSVFNHRVPCGQCVTCRLTTDKSTLKDVAEPLMQIDPGSSDFSAEASKLLLRNPSAMQCLYNVHYAEGSRLQGLFYTDVLWLNMEKPKHKNPEIKEGTDKTHDTCPAFPIQPGPSLPIIVPVGCHVEETHLFHDQKASGILGLEFWGTRGITTFPTSILNDLETMYSNSTFAVSDCGDTAAAELRQPTFDYAFSICLAPKGGSLSFGGSHLAHRPAGHTVKKIPLLSHSWRSQSYTVGMTKISVLRNATLSPPIHTPAYFSLLNKKDMWIELPINYPSYIKLDHGRQSVMPTLIDSGTTLTYMPPRLFGELLFNIENRVAVNTGIRDKQKLVTSMHRALERVEPATLFTGSDVKVIVRDRFMTRAERGRTSHLEFIPVATALVSTGPKRLVRVSSTIADSSGRLLLDQINLVGANAWESGNAHRRLGEENPPGWYAVLEPSADPANEPLDALVGFLDVPLDMEAAAPRALISKLDGYNNGECWWLQDPQKDLPMFPILKFTFYPDQNVFWHPLSYMYSGSNQHFWCLAMMTDSGRGSANDDSLDNEAIFGSNSFIHQDITFKHNGRPAAIEGEDDAHDLSKHTSEYKLHDKSLLEFAEADCPSISIEK